MLASDPANHHAILHMGGLYCTQLQGPSCLGTSSVVYLCRSTADLHAWHALTEYKGKKSKGNALFSLGIPYILDTALCSDSRQALRGAWKAVRIACRTFNTGAVVSAAVQRKSLCNVGWVPDLSQQVLVHIATPIRGPRSAVESSLVLHGTRVTAEAAPWLSVRAANLQYSQVEFADSVDLSPEFCMT